MKFMKILRQSKVGRKYIASIYNFLCENFLNRFTAVPDQLTIEKSAVFFSDKQERIEKIKTWLSDELSIQTFDSVINARVTGNIKQLQKIKCKTPEYFPGNNIIKLQDNEIFVDCGAFNGDTIRRFFNECKKSKVHPKKIYAFEPADLSYTDLQEYVSKLPSVVKNSVIIAKKGVYDKATVLHFSDITGVGARVTDSENPGEILIETISLDEVCKNEQITFIKMDIEGSELYALQGAKKIISENHPKLAICIYHSDDDILRLIEYVHSIVPDYKFYIRHYGDGNFDTILYCVL